MAQRTSKQASVVVYMSKGAHVSKKKTPINQYVSMIRKNKDNKKGGEKKLSECKLQLWFQRGSNSRPWCDI